MREIFPGVLRSATRDHRRREFSGLRRFGNARASGLTQIYGHVLAHNTTMLAMCEQLGFATSVENDDATLIKATLVLGNLPTAAAGTAAPLRKSA